MFKLYLLILLFGGCLSDYVPEKPKIIRPCPTLDPCCIRTYFARYSGCTPMYGSAPDTLYDGGRLSLPMPHANTSSIWVCAPQVKGLNDWEFVEFFVNRDSNTIVLEVAFPEITTYSPESAVKYYFKGREPLELNGYFGITYRKLSLTAIIPYSVKGVRWNDKEVYSYHGDAIFPFTACDSLCDNPDPVVQAACREWKCNIGLNVVEAGVIKGSLYFDRFFDNSICKFK